MPDLNVEIYFHCETDREWSTMVPSSSGPRSYKVTWDRHSHLNHTVQYDYSCDCMGYRGRFRRTRKHCKHIRQVVAEHRRCGWSQFKDGGEPVKKDGEFFCPKCGEPAFPLRYGV